MPANFVGLFFLDPDISGFKYRILADLYGHILKIVENHVKGIRGRSLVFLMREVSIP